MKLEQIIDSKNVTDNEYFETKNIYLAAFLISNDFFNLSHIAMDNPEEKATVIIYYKAKHKSILDNFINNYKLKQAICNLNLYQKNIRSIMDQINEMKSEVRDIVNAK